ncbi:putative oxidoreductase [Dinoroseobacter shibae DFL 12 = DSM 16493]|jgi:predicted dehydrogenase|uniref:Putative oxidoreductase n=1 Tax=Dinoroseobacter shibae (strain DSM 16493 / NCIMB 14021 / DFL 12) TaxID=398580 RepID=A8LI07_DINSH|nr:Gfo/Idh/MocA family oxidoreductase [Dinoroseobacter shibae]ABV94341.1 putative oxidoreductase [Dinoroseobacter shibae DFL 12 = DSM 16493]URF45772.1 Gfo/Idh/MocA family oxidoreductase [Dinoroseobacter shibae]URF50078.1 Gfo/Idh/MocA family oxidoreductase [Dinoroseobacter shibae]
MTTPLRWGILGAAKFAREQMGPAIHAARGATLAALASRDAAKAAPFRAFAPGLRVHTDYDALLADPEVDAVYIPLPHPMHVPWAMKALEAGKHVLAEKPLAMTAAEIDPLISRRNATGLHCAEAYMIVHHPQWQRARALLREGAIGRLVHVAGIFTYDNRADPGNIRNAADQGGGGIPDIGVYTYGCTRWMTEAEPEAITHADITWENGVDTIARVSARFPGFTAHWVNSMRMAPFQDMVFHGETGVLRLTAPFNAQVFGEARVELHRPGGGGDHTVTVERFPAANQYVAQVEAFGRTVREGAEYPWSLEDARGTQAMIDAVYAAAKG